MMTLFKNTVFPVVIVLRRKPLWRAANGCGISTATFLPSSSPFLYPKTRRAVRLSIWMVPKAFMTMMPWARSLT